MVNQARIKNVVLKHLFNAPLEQKTFFPSTISEPNIELYPFQTNSYFILSFVDREEKKLLEKFRGKQLSPFPGLIKPDEVPASVAFSVDKAKNVFITGCTVKNSFSFSLGKDCTIVLQNHVQSIRTKNFGEYEYMINLAFIISFGDEINVDNCPVFFDNLIEYVIGKWLSNK